MDICGLASIIIPVYNVAAYIEESLESVLHQTYRNLEILLIDDGSTDGSEKICDEYEKRDSRIRVVHQENRGLSAARNTGLNMMSGDAVAFLDSDDALMPDYIEKMVASMVKENADLVLCKYLTYRTTGRMSGEGVDRVRPLIAGGIYDHVTALQAMADRQFNHSAWNKLYSRKLWDGIRYPEGQVYEDIATTFQIVSRCDKICILDNPLYRYRKRPGSILETHSSRNVNDWLSSCSRFEAFVEQNIPDIFSKEQLKNLRQWRINGMVSYYIQLYDKDAEYCKTLRSRIIDEGKEYGIGDYGLRRKLFYWIVCSCPGLLYMVCPAYSILRRGYRVLKRVI